MFTVSGRLTPIELRILLYLVRSLKLKQYAGKYGCHDKWGHENATTQYDSSVTYTETEKKIQKIHHWELRIVLLKRPDFLQRKT